MLVVLRKVVRKLSVRFCSLVSLICLLNSPVLGADSQARPDSPSSPSQPTRESVIQELLQRHQAVEFEEPYRGEYSTLALQDALIGEDGRPILLKNWRLADVGRKLGSDSTDYFSDYFMVFSNRSVFTNRWFDEPLDFILDCKSEHVRPKYVKVGKKYLVVAKISSVHRWLYEAIAEGEEETRFPDVMIRTSKDYIARGTCIEIVELPPDLEAEKILQEVGEKERKRRRSLREVITETLSDLYEWALDHLGVEEQKQK